MIYMISFTLNKIHKKEKHQANKVQFYKLLLICVLIFCNYQFNSDALNSKILFKICQFLNLTLYLTTHS